ncbi:MAG: hypothetical protein JJE51_00885, partial [Thermoanaerobaculia bacterium]|nr:hypothetical protein [Thermoanaerobaculia bacterium]
ALTGESGKFSIRGGYGHYHGRVFQSIFSQSGVSVRFNPPNAASRTVTNVTNISDPSDGFVFVPGTIAPRATFTLIDPDLQMPETRQWNLTFERQVFDAAKLRVSYIGTLGKNLLQYRIDNKPVVPAAPGTVGAAWVVAQDWRCAGTGLAGAAINATCPVAVPIAANEVSLRFPRNNERRPDARYGQNISIANLAESNYHAGQLEFETGLWHGLSGRTTYTFSKAIDTGSEATLTGTGDLNIFPDDDEYKRGLSRFDTRHRFTLSSSYLMPFFQDRKDWMGSLLGGWQLSTLMRFSSGTPFTIVDTAAPDIDFDGVVNQRPICIRSGHCGGYFVNHPSNSQAELPANAFRRAVYGDTTADFIGRNTFTTDGLETVDLGLYKSFRLPIGSDAVMLRLDVFNVFNHVTWSWPTNDFASANFGRITAVSDSYSPRTFQLGLRYIY